VRRARNAIWAAEPFRVASNVSGECYETHFAICRSSNSSHGVSDGKHRVSQEPGSDCCQCGRDAESVHGPGSSQSGPGRFIHLATCDLYIGACLFERFQFRSGAFLFSAKRPAAGYGLVPGLRAVLGRSGLWSAAGCLCNPGAATATHL